MPQPDLRQSAASPHDQNRGVTVGRHFRCLATEDQALNSASAVRCHDDQVAIASRRSIENFGRGMPVGTCSVSAVQRVGIDIKLAGLVPGRRQNAAGKLFLRFIIVGVRQRDDGYQVTD